MINFHGHVLILEAEGDPDAFVSLIKIIEEAAPYMLDNVLVRSITDRDGSAESMGETARLVFPDGVFDEDNDGQAVLYTGAQVIDSEVNPTIPAGESQVVRFVAE